MTLLRRFQRLDARLALLERDLAKARALVAAAHDAAAITLPDGYPAGGDGEVVSGGHTGRPVEATVIARAKVLDGPGGEDDDGNARRAGLDACETSARVIAAAVGEISKELIRLARTRHHGHKTIGDQPGSGNCQACLRWVDGTGENRIRSGFCPRDAQRWYRAERPDRAQFVRAVQLELGLITEEESIVELGPDGTPADTAHRPAPLPEKARIVHVDTDARSEVTR